MGFVDKNTRVMRLSDSKQFIESREIAIHRINSLDDYELALARPPSERRVERIWIVVLETINPATRKDGTVP